ncbi:hypothetical protein [Wenxinia saemankumensis]|uniref:PA14 domain-containing protein n=1 Tax=Wenxinia saemankumensis TaxID=1447782 RepID=A0A1M6EK05_9RHOB|nr:hypothetical protein [Wenxinia saemankumensis]SHI85736.1 hypothetical protein SAMN05444417_2033 [Wenxinia saemankumensis]
MPHLTRPLPAGAPLTLWRHSPVAAAEFDVEPRPMKGEMDPFFFLTKEKNFIPHEYPCRTEFAARFRGRRPEPLQTGPAEEVWLGFGSPRLDLSGFWFRATRVAARATGTILAEAAGRARLRLATCGGAILTVNGQEVLWTAAYKRNFEESAEVEVDLVPGENRVEVVFDDLAERDARFYVQLDYLSGPAARQGIDVQGTGAASVEDALTRMHVERASYDGGTVALILAAPLPGPARATIRVEGDFMSHDPYPPVHVDLAEGATRIEVGAADDLPADFRHLAVRLEMDGFAAERTFGTEISHATRQGPAPSTLLGRIDEALAVIARDGESDTVRALARLATGDGGDETRRMIEDTLPRIDACWDCADFALVPLIWGRSRFGDLLGADLCARIDATILGYRYWMDEPGNDVQWYFSENHALLFHTAAHLGGHLLPEATFARSGRTGAEQSRIGAERLRAWFDHFEQWEMAEFNSGQYFPIDLKGLTAIQALSPDADLRDRAAKAIARLVEIVANSAHRGVLTAAQGRSYEHSLRAAGSHELTAMARMLWGTGSFGARFHCVPGLALCLRDHDLDLPNLTSRAVWRSEDAQDWSFAQGQNRIAKLTHYKTADYALGTATAYRWYDWGYQETLLQLRMGSDPNAQVWINHPGEVIHSGYGRPSYWGGSASVPRVQQYRDLAIVRFAGQPPQPAFIHAWFPAASFDAARVEGDTAWAEAGAARLMLRASGPLEAVSEGPTAGNELRLAGLDGWWLVRLGRAAVAGGDFAARLMHLRPEDREGTLALDDPDYGMVLFHPDGTVEGEGRRIRPEDITVSGTRTILPRGPLRT